MVVSLSDVHVKDILAFSLVQKIDLNGKEPADQSQKDDLILFKFALILFDTKLSD